MITRVIGWLTLFVVGTDLFVISPLLPAITRGFGVSVSAGGTTVTVFALAYLVGGPTFGAVADRRGRHGVLTVALTVFAAANLLTALAPNLSVLLAARLVSGLAASGITPSVYALVGAAAPPQQRARWLAVVTSGLLLALATGAPAGSLFGAAVSWRGVFALLTVAAVAILAVTRRAHLRGDQPPPVAASAASTRQPSVALRLRAVSVTALWALAVYGLYTYLGTILRDAARMSSASVALALVCFGLGAVLGNLAGGQLADRHGGRITSIGTLCLLAAAETAVGLTIHSATALLLTMLGLTALVAYPFFSAQQARLLAAYPGASGSLMAWNNSAMYAGILVGSAVGGPVLTRWGGPTLAIAAAGVAVLAACVAVGSIPRRLSVAESIPVRARSTPRAAATGPRRYWGQGR